jgi:Cu-Zn family superoxide dismutase
MSKRFRLSSQLKGYMTPVIVAALLVGVGCAKKESAEHPAPPAPEQETQAAMEPMSAVATLESKDGVINGMIRFTETADGVAIEAHVEGAPPGPHGFHIHEIGDCSSDDFKSAGGHFNPGGVPHGGPMDGERHAGDLGNIEVGADGSGHLELSSDLVTVAEGPSSVIGRGLILHAGTDDLVSQPTGAAGARLACGVISAGG